MSELPKEIILETLILKVGNTLDPICIKANQYGRSGYMVTKVRLTDDAMAYGEEARVEIWGYKKKSLVELSVVEKLVEALRWLSENQNTDKMLLNNKSGVYAKTVSEYCKDALEACELYRKDQTK